MEITNETFLFFNSLEWNALGVISIFLVSFIALIVPILNKKKEIKNKLLLVEKEWDNNSEIIIKACEKNLNSAPEEITKEVQQLMLMKGLSLNEWNQFKYDIAIFDSDKFYFYKSFNSGNIEYMIDTVNNYDNEKFPSSKNILNQQIKSFNNKVFCFKLLKLLNFEKKI